MIFPFLAHIFPYFPMQTSLCDECECSPAQYSCISCEQFLCFSCDLKIHDKGKRKAHPRTLLSEKDKKFNEEKNNVFSKEISMKSPKENSQKSSKAKETSHEKSNEILKENSLKKLREISDEKSREKSGVSKSEILRNDVSKSEVSKNEASQNEVSRNEVSKSVISQSEVSKSEVSKSEFSKNEISQNEVSKTEVSRSEVSKNEVSKSEISQNEISLKEEANAIVFSLSLNLVSKESILLRFQELLLQFIRVQTMRKKAQIVYLLVWNSNNNEKINKIMLGIQIELNKQKVLVFFMKFMLDLRNFFTNFKTELEKHDKIHVFSSNSLQEQIEACIPNSSRFSLQFFDQDFLINNPYLSENTAKKAKKNDDLNQTIHSFPQFSLENDRIDKEKNLFFSEKNLDFSEFFPHFQPYKALDPRNFPPKISLFLQDLFREQARNGLLMLEKPEFLLFLSQKLISSRLSTPETLTFLLQQAENQHIFHTTIRRFGSDSNVFPYISMHLDQLSLESLIWVLRSLMKDSMTPTEKLILGRIKETFSLKITSETLKRILETLSLKIDKNSLIKVHKELSPLRIEKSENSEEICVFLAWEKWKCEDQGVLSVFDQEDWDEFLDFLRKFYYNSPFSSQISFKSVENSLEKNEGKKKNGYFNKKFLKNFIPGGKYGCCQYIKCCGTPRLKQISFGKLSLFVQEAINRRILEYYKTLLISTEKLRIPCVKLEEKEEKTEKNERNQDFCENQRILEIKEIIMKIIGSFPQGINLARLPKMIQFYTNFPFDCQDFGFKKLKDFLNIFKEVEMLEFGDNIVAKIRKNKENFGDFKEKWSFVNDPMYSYNCYKKLENLGIF